ncbi:hypothetical protein BBU_294 [Burkholderia pseudomallei NAU35A-3]|nr:hypothetical protein BBU_294 [Burkholderia pseudomallei NAU35A-3]MBM5689590.1 hypothetical protein [Burkholderia pseudomallei]
MTAIARAGGRASREHTRVPRRAANRRGGLKRMHARPVTVVHSRNGEEAKGERDEKRMGRKANERVLAYTGSHRGRNGMPRSCPVIPRARAH